MDMCKNNFNFNVCSVHMKLLSMGTLLEGQTVNFFFREYINLIDDELEDDDDPLVQEAIATSLQQDQYK